MTDDTDALKARRQARKTPGAAAVTAGNTVLSAPPPEAKQQLPTTVSAAIANSRSKILFHPGEHPAIVQNAGYVPKALLDDLYVVADCDVTESVVPPRATTAVSKLLWTKGCLVRKDIYAQWENIRDAAKAAKSEAASEEDKTGE